MISCQQLETTRDIHHHYYPIYKGDNDDDESKVDMVIMTL